MVIKRSKKLRGGSNNEWQSSLSELLPLDGKKEELIMGVYIMLIILQSQHIGITKTNKSKTTT